MKKMKIYLILLIVLITQNVFSQFTPVRFEIEKTDSVFNYQSFKFSASFIPLSEINHLSDFVDNNRTLNINDRQTDKLISVVMLESWFGENSLLKLVIENIHEDKKMILFVKTNFPILGGEVIKVKNFQFKKGLYLFNTCNMDNKVDIKKTKDNFIIIDFDQAHKTSKRKLKKSVTKSDC